MTTTTLTRPDTRSRIRTAALIVGIIGVIAGIIGVLTDSEAFFQAYIVGFAFVANMSLGCLFLLMIHHVTGGHWGNAVRPFLELGAQLNVVTALLFIPIVLGLPMLYPWAQPDTVSADPLLQHKSAFLNPTFFVIRAVVYFAVWIILAWLLTRKSGTHQRQTAIIGLILHFALATLAMIDWFMSLEPHWYSTIYGVVFLTTEALTAFAFVLVVFALTTPVEAETEGQTRQDFGNVLLTILVAWVYMNFIQFLVIWAGDLTEEIPWYLARSAGGWSGVALGLIIFDFVVPFVLLLSRRIKGHARGLGWVALLMLVAQFVFAYWMIVPAFNRSDVTSVATLTWQDVVLPVGIAGIWIAAFLFRLPARIDADLRTESARTEQANES